MKQKLLSACLVMIAGFNIVNAQVNIGSITPPDASAALQISATDKGLRLPQVSLTNTASYLTSGPSSSATVGMQVYNTNAGITGSTAYPASGAGVYTWDGNGWKTPTPSNIGETAFYAYNGAATTVNNNTGTTLDLGTVYMSNSSFVTASGSALTIVAAGTYLIEGQGNFIYNVTENNSGGSFQFGLSKNGNVLKYFFFPKPYGTQGTWAGGTNVPGNFQMIATFTAGDVISFTARDYDSPNGQGLNLDVIKITEL